MKVVIQRCTQASVTIGGQLKSSIGPGMMILMGIEDADDILDDIKQALDKI